MAFTAGGPDAQFTVDVDVDADAAAAELEAKLTKAVHDAFKNPVVQQGFQAMISAIAKGMAGVSKQTGNTFKSATTAGVKSAQTIGNAFKKVGDESKKAFDFNSARGARGEITALNATVQGLVHTLDNTGLKAKESLRLISDLTRSANAQARLATQESRTVQQAEQSAQRAKVVETQKEIAAARDASNQAIAAARNRVRYIIEAERTIVRAISATWRGAERAVSAFTRAAGATLRGFGRTVSSIFEGIGRSISGIGRGFASVFSGLTRAATAAARGLSRAFSAGNKGDESAWKSSLRNRERALQSSLNSQSRAIQNFSNKSRQGILGALSGRGAVGLGAGLAGGAGIMSLLTSGFERAGQVEQLQLTFEALLGDSDKATAVLDRLSDYARTTSFDFVEVAQSTAQLTAALGDVDKAESLTKFLGDVVALTGGTTESLGRVRLAMSQIAGAGRLDSANLRQITESLPGVPIAQILADRFFGGSMEAYSAARDAGELGGKISAEAFFEAFQEGTREKFPSVEGFAQTAAGTLTGMTQNLKENFAIFGATIITLASGPIKAAIGTLNEFLNLAGQFVSGEMFQQPGHDLFSTFIPDDARMSKTLENLKLFRTILGNVLKALGALLAVKGVIELFGLIGSGIRLALTPMGLLVVAITAITAAWTYFASTNAKFAKTWETVKAQIRPTIDAFVRLGSAIKKAFGGGSGDGKPSILTRIGDALRYVNVGLGRVIVSFRDFANSLTESLNVKGFKDFGASLDLAIGEGLAEIFFGPAADERKARLKAQGGSYILNVLEDTFLGPVIRFFRGPFLDIAKTITGFIGNIVGQIAGAIGDIWGIIFGGEDKDPQRQLVNGIFGTADDRSTGTKILDRLEETFLGPVIRFFRGPFANALSGVGDFVGGLFSNFLIPGFKAVFNFFAHDFIPGIVDVAQSIGSFLSPAVHSVGDLLGQVGTLLSPIGGAIQGFVETWKSEGVAKAFSSLWDGITESAANLWDGEDGNGGIKAGLESVINSITSWFSTTFTGKNATDWGRKAFDGLRKVGYYIGKFLSSPEFLGTVIISAAAVAAAVAAIIAAFTLGLAQGVLEEVGRWAGIISKGLTAAWNSLAGGALKFLPDPIKDAIGFVFKSPILSTAIAGGTVLLGAKILSAIISGIATAATPTAIAAGGPGGGANLRTLGVNIVSGLFTSIRNALFGVKGKEGSGGLLGGFRSLGAMIFPKPTGVDEGAASAGRSVGGGVLSGLRASFTGSRAYSAIINLRGKLHTAADQAKQQYGSVGTAIATAIIGGIADYEINYQAAKSGSTGGKLLGLLFGTATGAAYGASIGGGPGAVIGAVLGAGIAVLGQHFGEAAKKAEEFDAVVKSIRESLSGIGDDAQVDALLTNLSDRLTSSATDFENWGQAFINSGFDFGGFVSDIIAGTAEADRAFTDFLGGDTIAAQIQAAGGDLQGFQDTLRQLQETAKTGDYTDIADLFTGAGIGLADGRFQSFMDTLQLIGYTGEDVGHIFGTLTEYVKGTAAAQATLAGQASLAGATVKDTLDTTEEAVTAINTALGQGDTAQQIADILSNDDLSSTNALEALATAADDVAKKLDEAKQAFTDALNAVDVGQYDVGAKTFEGITSKIIADLPTIAAGFQQIYDDVKNGEIAVNVGDARIIGNTDNFKAQITGLISEAVDAGLITDDASMDTFLENIKTQINSAGLEPEVANMLNGIVDAFINGDYSDLLTPITSALTDQQTLAETGRIMAERIRTSLQSHIGQNTAGSGTFLGAATVLPSSTPGITLPRLSRDDLSAVFDDADAAGVGHDAGQEAADNFLPGFRSVDLASPLKTELNATGNSLRGTAVSNGFRTGLTFTKSIGDGFRAGAGNVSAAAGNVTRAAAIAAGIAAVQMYQAGLNIGYALARGIRESGAAAVIAAIQVAQAVANASKRALAIHSPSQVFVDIGKQVGAGFVKGIEDSTVSMTQALSTALETAISDAVDTSADAVNRANVAGRLFEILQPSTLPGGTSTRAVTGARTSITGSLAEFLPGLRSDLAGALGDIANDGLREASQAINGIGVDLAGSFADLRGQYADATAARDAIARYDRATATLRTQLRDGTLGNLAANRQRSEAYKALLKDQEAMTDKIARLRVQLNNGTIAGKTAADRLATFNEKVKDLRDSFSATTVEQYHEELDRITRALKNGSLAQEEYKQRLDDLGTRPDRLNFEQANLLASGFKTLNVGTIAGKANVDTLSDALSKIRDFGQAALEAGSPLGTVIFQMEAYTKKVTDQARTMGLAAKDVNALVTAFGLTDAQLRALQASIVSLDTTSVTGAQNVDKINDQLSAIREYASTLLQAGETSESVTAKIKELRNSLVAQAKTFGFNADGINALVEAAGLSDTALADFIKQLNDYTEAIKSATAATPDGVAGQGVSRPIGELHVHVPYGDPEAVALATANRIAYDSLTSWS